MKNAAMMSQGAKANYNGRKMEDVVKKNFTDAGWLVVRHSDYCRNPEPYRKENSILLTNVPYISITGKSGQSEFGYIRKEGRKTRTGRIEVKNQTVSGSADSKYAEVIQNALYRYPESEIVLVLNIPGASSGVLDWIKAQASDPGFVRAGKKLFVFTPAEFSSWFANELA